MKKNLILSVILILLAVGCSDNNITRDDDSNKINLSKNINFKVKFTNYNETQMHNVTRASNPNKLEQKRINLGNGVIAVCSLQQDTTKNYKNKKYATTRVLGNDTYTMLAYDAATHTYKGEMTGIVSDGAFVPADARKRILLEPGTYDFVLYNGAVNRSGNNLTVDRANINTALIGRTTYTVTASPDHQEVTFNMLHAGARVQIRLTSYMEIQATTTAKIESINSTAAPSSATYDAANGTWTINSGTAFNQNLTYPKSKFRRPLSYTEGYYISGSNEFLYFMPGTDMSQFKLTFTGGQMYKQNMSGVSINLSPASSLLLDRNGSYILNIKLMYNYLYLMSDGTVGTLFDTTYGGGNKTPIGIVVSRSKRLAMALTDAHSGLVKWKTNFNWANKIGYDFGEFMQALNDMNGYNWTWDASHSYDGVTIKANQASTYPSFYYAGAYVPPLPTGVHLTNGMENKKWYLPSLGEWSNALTALGVANQTATNWRDLTKWWGFAAEAGVLQVGGTTFLSKYYWTSTECHYSGVNYAGCLLVHEASIYWNDYRQGFEASIRSFIKY